ncbi:MAG: 1-acyl-sn-glycerol-3-phosphate acyltransferase [Spirochaetia bacterium]|nr:1-acyl-sn-glycerol-3-phosphate acyltransferase [Spirochaetia bacterium]MCF7946775.1 1-acyl-sn-glycerol-3-phosphate acyltransferase [Spirochaetia bacterium]MCF7953365.1 1-acyl-sn-glycerol-3-phosphate acyltransferase [Spirochaetales bacterium]
MKEAKKYDFSDIAPYKDEDVSVVVNRLIESKQFLDALGEMIYPTVPYVLAPMKRTHIKHQIEQMLEGVTTINEVQRRVIYGLITHSVIEKTTEELTWSGLENIDKNTAYLFLSNHRDIALDPAFLNYILGNNGYPYTEISFGDNLLINQTITDIIRLDRGVIVKRSLPLREKFIESKRLSSYFFETIRGGRSIWVAQKSGRTKDGNDITNPATLKMLHLSQKETGISFTDLMKQCPVVPIAISYQYDPCDIMKSREIMYIKINGYYKKKKYEDLISILRGIKKFKGRVHIHIGTPISEGFSDTYEASKEVDRQIHLGYQLWDTNYMAYDYMMGNSDFSHKYSEKKMEKFISRFSGISEQLKRTVIESYANPVINQRKALEKEAKKT